MCFEKKIIRSPTEIICLTSSFIVSWANLQQEGNREVLVAGAEGSESHGAESEPQEASTLEQCHKGVCTMEAGASPPVLWLSLSFALVS
jgi:hypothetical protein